MRFEKSEKLSPRFIRPFEILEQIEEEAYRLDLPTQLSRVHNVFHASMLRKYEPDPSHVLDWVNLEIDEDASYEEQLVQILDIREQVLRGKNIPSVKVLQRHHGVEETTWEWEAEVRSKVVTIVVKLMLMIIILVVIDIVAMTHGNYDDSDGILLRSRSPCYH
ncbi:uncharacterized protein LOC114305790 [Camellia sinensis]|uniref:uncharacterized protein LOC114305790 n=1 Tax=Camellia sinensis TaxID=4442 RepID=UPI001035B13D|nr:uncharacterized protein LOC114305790 [Camellia sinensis]